MEGSLFQSFFLIFTSAAIIASIALYTRQPLLVAYIILGALLGPYGFKLITNVDFVFTRPRYAAKSAACGD